MPKLLSGAAPIAVLLGEDSMTRFMISKRGPQNEWQSTTPGQFPMLRDAATAQEKDVAWFDSSWELRKGLEVAELDSLPQEADTTLARRAG